MLRKLAINLKGQNMMKKNPVKIILIWIITGVLIGTLIGIIGVIGHIPKDKFLSFTGMIIRLCLGAIVLLIDSLCIWALLRPTIIKHIDRNGEKIIGKIENITVIPHPDHLGEDNWIQKARFAFIVSYEVDSKKYCKEYSPTCLTSKKELYPQIIEIGEDIPIKYYKKAPQFSLIDINLLKNRLRNEQNNARIHFIMIPIILTSLYVIAIIYNVI